MRKENDQQKAADELLKKLHAAFLNDRAEADDTDKISDDELMEPLDFPELEELEKPAPETKEILEPEEQPEEESAPEDVPVPETKPAPSAAPAVILELTQDAPDVTGKKPETPDERLEETPAPQKEPEKPQPAAKRTRPNTVKVPPRRRSGVNTGAIGQRKAAASSPALKIDPQFGDITAPRVGAERKAEPQKDIPNSEPRMVDPLIKSASDEPNINLEEALPSSTIQKTPPIVVDIDRQASSTVEPIEDTEASETVTEPPIVEKKQKKAFKRRAAEDELDATSVIAQRTGLDESDIALIFELGYENELGRLVGYETLKKLKYEHLRHSRANTGDYYGQAFGYRGREYTSNLPAENVFAAYAHDRRKLIIRTALLVLAAALLFFADFPSLFTGFFQTTAIKLPYLFPILGLLLFSATVALMWRRIFTGWKAFLQFAPTPYSLVAVTVPFVWLYGIGTIITAGSSTLVLPPMNFASVIMLLSLLLCDALRIADEIRTFRMISCPDQKVVLEEAEPRKKKVRQGNRTIKIINDEAGEALYRVRRSREIVGFFRRVNDLSAASSPFTKIIICLLICAVAGGLAASLIFDPLRGVLTFAATFAFSAPACAALLFFDPLRRANRHLLSRRSVLVGEGSVNEYSEPKTIIFNDTYAFRAKRQTQIDLQDGDEFRRDIRLAEALFRKIGGTLSTVDQPIPMAENPDTSISLVRLTETGVEALIDNKFRVLAGDATFLTHNGVELPKESTDRAVSRSRGVSALFVAINGSLKLTYEIAYTMNQSFREIISLVARTNTTLAVQSYDPNLNNAFLHIGFADGDDVVRVIKPAQFETPTTAEITDTGVITLDGPLASAYPLRAASLIVGTRRAGFRTLMASIFPGMLLAFFLSCLLPSNLLPFLPLMAVGHRLIWLAVSWILSAYMLRRQAIFEDTRENLANENQN